MQTNHKGTWCMVQEDLFCQEGYCPGCLIFAKRDVSFGSVGKGAVAHLGSEPARDTSVGDDEDGGLNLVPYGSY